MVRLGLAVCAFLPCVALSACHTRVYAPGDGGFDAFVGDAPSSDVAGTLALDVAVTGCASFDVVAERCAGPPPLALAFSPVSSASLTRFLWTFGDGSPTSSERAPTHTYVLPGTYDVSVVGAGAAGSVSRTRAQLVVVAPLATGVPCDVDAQCGLGSACLCGGGACAPTFARGLCTSVCPTAGCGTGTVCATLDVPVRATATADAGVDATDAQTTIDGTADAADARDDSADASSDSPSEASSMIDEADAAVSDAVGADASDVGASTSDAHAGTDAAHDAGGGGAVGATPVPLCLASCVADTDCAVGLVCRALPAAGATQVRWARACVPPVLRDVGDSCRDDSGALADGLCATGTCADVGALGLCSATCGVGLACPSGSACATFGDGRSLCLSTCAANASCTRDPLLDCEAAGAVGTLSFQVSPPAPTAMFCAPRICTSQADCGLAGTCTPLGVGAHCARND
ncbi:MAG TPA: PKD domain-containing protein [Polyangia bacterium]|jgi:PKD repeat protein|nr:PKD domain-containing protein [Polyangia bacterium]